MNPQASNARPEKLIQSKSAEESFEIGGTSPLLQSGKQTRPRWSTLLGLKTPQQNQVCEILNLYTKNGVPQPKTVHKFESANLANALRYIDNMHTSWKEFIRFEHMSEREIKIQSAIWELVSTEVDYIHVLQTVTDVRI